MRADASQRPIEREQALSNLAKTQVEISKLHQEMGTPETHTYEGQLYERPKGGGVGAPVSAVAGFPQGQKLNEDQSKTLGYFQRVHVAAQQLGDKDKALAGLQDVAAGKVLPFPEYAQTPEYQKARTNAMAWIYAILRKESGAVIGKEEEDKYLRIFFPVPGNTPDVIADKAELRRTAERGLYDALGDAKHHADKFVAERAAARTATDRTDALEWLKNNPSDPRAPAIRQRLGL